MKNIGFAGIGTMGAGMANNLVKAGYKVFVYNRTKSKAESIKEAIVVDSPAELCEKSEVIFICVSNDEALKNILFDENGIFSKLTEKNILVDSGTISVALTDEVANKCDEKNVEFLDAPITGGKKGADEGTLMFMIGGKKDTFEKCRDVFAVMGDKLVYCGGNTYGQRMKITLNLTQAMTLEAYLEGVALGLKNGLTLGVIRDVLDNSGARSNVAIGKMPAITHHDFTPNFLLELMNKDVRLAEQEIRKLGISLPLAEAMIKVLQETMDKGYAKEDWVSIAKLLEEKVGVEIK
ncbi:hypothetical protein CMO88_01920 [Candidatus Woesearchaeota archaeon]|jgi:3-hydroxyisobutyrate dehydrogenase-like beta-hydroxyacid dehydrogenase|nr:hypothetical protein [Candidatus Woesearchaeota archaeon]|tara:strand:+ start:8280 stop:9158 length:879 start_codon:yes stop_codon:yes gene_type:complete